MRRATAASAALLLAGMLTIGIAPAANAHSFSARYHYDFSTGGWDIDFLGTAESYSGNCYPRHLDVVRARVQFCPWCSWHLDEVLHCTTV